jgi:hypothetical protein
VVRVGPMRALLLIVAVQLALAGAARATIFADQEMSPRARALGGAYAGLSADATGIYYNPAGLADVEMVDLFGSIYQPFGYAFSRVSAFAMAVPTAEWGTIAFGYNDFRVEYENTTLSIERAFTFAHGFVLMEDLSSSLAFGYALNLYNLDYPTPSVSGIDLGSQSAFGLDVGFIARLHQRTTAGVFAKNLNNPEMGETDSTDLPQRISGGIAYQPYTGVITVAEVEKELGEDVQFHGGMEFRIAEPLCLRFGAQSKPNLFHVGAGLSYRNVKIDVTYTHHPVLDATLHTGLGVSF